MSTCTLCNEDCELYSASELTLRSHTWTWSWEGVIKQESRQASRTGDWWRGVVGGRSDEGSIGPWGGVLKGLGGGDKTREGDGTERPRAVIKQESRQASRAGNWVALP